jgi:hypothetical protein
MDVLTYTGIYNFYTDPEFRSFYEWLYGHATTAFKRLWVFGDSYYESSIECYSSINKAGNFSDKAGAYAAWIMSGSSVQKGGIFNYVLHRANAQPERAKSKIYPDGGAFLFEDTSNTTSMDSALWNCKKDDGHAHKDVNSINAAAYGEFVLVNSGYYSWGSGVLGYTWNYIWDRAVSGNTALINYSLGVDSMGVPKEKNPDYQNDHKLKYGGGITEGIISRYFAYASGDSGNALPNGKHIRSLVSVFPQDAKNGYWVLFDELDADAANAGKCVQIALHPPAASCTVVNENKEYLWNIKKYTKNGVNLSIYPGTVPDKVTLYNGVIASSRTSFAGKYLFSSYLTNANDGKKNVVTVLFPHDGTHKNAKAVTQISGNGYTGACIDLDGTNTLDYALESNGASIIEHEGVNFQGLAALYRKANGNNKFYFVRKGRCYKDGKYGFAAENTSISIYMKDTAGNISSQGTKNVTFYYPGITGVKINGTTKKVSKSGNGWVVVSVPEETSVLH